MYGAFLLWAIAQERCKFPRTPSFPSSSQLTPRAVSAPFPPATHEPHAQPAKFPSPLFFNWSQALASATASAVYLLLGAASDGSLKTRGVWGVLGLDRLFGAAAPAPAAVANGKAESKTNGKANGHGHAKEEPAPTPLLRTLPALLLQVALFQTTAGPIGFLALRHISYPTMVLGKVSVEAGGDASASAPAATSVAPRGPLADARAPASSHASSSQSSSSMSSSTAGNSPRQSISSSRSCRPGSRSSCSSGRAARRAEGVTLRGG